VVGSASRRLATIGLTAVLVLLAGFSLWAAVRTNAAARQVDRDSAEQDVWQNARVALANVEAARHGYVEHRRTEARADVARRNRSRQASPPSAGWAAPCWWACRSSSLSGSGC
jgi:hypothetical protein